jgi:hypothetical protein
MAERVARAPSPRPGPSTSQKPVDQTSKNMNELVQHWQKSNLISVPRGYTLPLGLGKERTRYLSRRARGYGVEVSNNGSGGRHATTTLTGIEDAGRRGARTRSRREMAGEDE